MRNINNIFLPKSNKNEDLEELSRRKFAPLFDEERFILKGEIIDNGVDLRIEIKRGSNKLGFGFNFQLKSKEIGKKNNDGSYSKSIETKNIEYLLNNGQPAFYAFYVKNEDQFYFIHLNDVLFDLNNTKPDWESQPNHTIRFIRKLDSNAINEIYQIAFSHGMMLRKINFKGAILRSTSNTPQKILVDFQKNVTDNNEIREMIEGIGLEIINEGKWKDVIFVHENATVNIATTSKYCLIVGIALYYNGQLIDALVYFKKAQKLIDNLAKDLKDYLDFYYLTTQYLIGLIEKPIYKEKISILEKNNINLGFYINLEKIVTQYHESSYKPDKKYEIFLKKLNEIIENPDSSDNIKLLCKCEILLYRGFKNNMELVQNISIINALENSLGVEPKLRIESAKKLINDNNEWFEFSKKLREEAIEKKNYFIFYIAQINEAKVIYQFEVFTDYVFVTKEFPGVSNNEKPDKSDLFNKLLSDIEASYNYFTSIGHTANIIASLSLKYEIYRYLKKENQANIVLKKLENIVNLYDSPDSQRKLGYLKNKGTTHETFFQFIQGINEKGKREKKEYQNLVDKMRKMDVEEEKINRDDTNKHHINLFPIGYFSFPKDHVNIVLNKLNVIEETQKKYLELLKNGIVPIFNLYHDPITKTGIQEGYLLDEGVRNWRRIYEIRKFFFNQKYFRVFHYD